MPSHVAARHSFRPPVLRGRRQAASDGRSPKALRLALEQLEARTLLSIFMVDRADDSAAVAGQVCSAAAHESDAVAVAVPLAHDPLA